MGKERYTRCVQRKKERGCCIPCEMRKKLDPWDKCPVIPPCLSPMRNPPPKPEQHPCARPPPKKVCVNGKIEKVPQPPYEWWDPDNLPGQVRMTYHMPETTYPEPYYLPKTYFVPDCRGGKPSQPGRQASQQYSQPHEQQQQQLCFVPYYVPMM